MARERRRSRSARLDTPRGARRTLPTPSYDRETFGRFSESIARFLGTARFLFYMTVFVAVWLAWNTLAPENWQFDPRALNYTLLTLILSLQASYAAPLILLAQNRQDDRDRVQYEQDRGRADRAIADTEYLTRELAALRIAVGEVATRDFVRSELRALLEEIEERASGPDPESGGTAEASPALSPGQDQAARSHQDLKSRR
jgi:uncharacterized membrane protein